MGEDARMADNNNKNLQAASKVEKMALGLAAQRLDDRISSGRNGLDGAARDCTGLFAACPWVSHPGSFFFRLCERAAGARHRIDDTRQ